MKIIFSKHALEEKFTYLRKHNFHISKTEVVSIVKDPDHLDRISDKPKLIASREIDSEHILRVVYKLENGIITIITFYPAEKGRYYK